jgi:tetratricopeptide (TPR) repeat protein
MTSIWWVQQGYPPFDAGPDGFPRPGQVIRHFRRIKLKADGKPWTQRDLAHVLNKQELAIRDMELRDIGLNDISRRRFLARLFDIPPILLGLATIPEHSASNIQESSHFSLNSKHIVSIEEVRSKLTLFWTNTNNNSPQNEDILVTITSVLRRLYERYPVALSVERSGVITDLCELHIHAANILRDRGKFSKSLEHLNKAEILNASLQEDELQADLLYRRGGVYLEKFAASLALDDYHRAEKMLTNISYPLQAAILLETALSEARVATSQQQCAAALKKIDRAGHIIRVERTETGRERWPYLNVDLGRYHLDRSAALIILGNLEEALQELNLLSPSHLRGRRSIYHLILQAQAYFGLKEYAQAAFLAEEALPLAYAMRSHTNLERIKRLHKLFQQSPFRDNPEVARLGYMLFQA